MSNTAQLYWLTRLNPINGFFIVITVLLFVAAIGIIIGCWASSEFDEFETKEKIEIRKALRLRFTSKLKYIITAGFISCIVSMFLPTRDEAIFIVAGGKTIDFIQQDSSVNKIPAQTTKIISTFLDNQIKSLESDTTK